MNRDKIGTQICYVHFSTMMYNIACLWPNLASVHFYAIPIFNFKFSINLSLITF